MLKQMENRASSVNASLLPSGVIQNVSEFFSWALITLLILGAIVAVAFVFIQKQHAIGNLRAEVRSLENNLAYQNKVIQNFSAELERLKGGYQITERARQLGLRPPGMQQSVERLHSIAMNTENPGLDWRNLALQ